MRSAAASPFWVDAVSDLPDAGLRKWGPAAVLLALTAVFAVGFAWLSVLRHRAFQSHAFDLGNMDQAVWNTLHGRLLWFTDMEVAGHLVTTRLAIHVEPILIALAPLYLVHSGAETLLVVQAVVVALGAVPAYLLARRATGRAWLSLVFPIAYLLHPSLQDAVLDDFHAVTLSSCFLMWAIYQAHRNSIGWFALFAVLAAATKEEVSLLVALLGVFFLLRGRVLAGFMTILLGVAWFLLAITMIIPAASPTGHSPYLARYAYLGHGIGGVFVGAARHPGLVLRTLVSEPRLEFLSFLLHPAGFVSVLQPLVLLLALPAWLIDMLSSDPRMYSGLYQYTPEIIPYIIAAAAFGVAMVSRVARRNSGSGDHGLGLALALLVLVAASVDSRRYGFTPAARGFIVPSAGPHQRLEENLLRLVPANAPVSAADEIEPHLSDRRWIYHLPIVHPRGAPSGQWIVLDASIPADPIEPRTLHAAVDLALRSGYGIVTANDGLLLLARGAGGHRLPTAFYSFAFRGGKSMTAETARWGGLRLAGLIVHPRDGIVNRSRPAIALDTYWTSDRRLSGRVRIAFYLSPVYTGAHPAFSGGWSVSRDSPTWDWLPMHRWPTHRVIHAVSLGLVPPTGASGRVDVAIGVSGSGPLLGDAGARVRGSSDLVRVGTIGVEP